MPLTVRDILHRLDQLAPPALAESWDNVGLLLGDPAREVTRVMTALDPTAEVLAQVEAMRAELLVTHHPLLFAPVKRLVEDGGAMSLLQRFIRAGCSVIAAHTNLDSAPHGLNTHVANLLGLRDTRPLVPSPTRPLLKLVVYVPGTHAEEVRVAISDAGAGQIGDYAECSFAAPGTGTFRPGAGTHPYIGAVDVLERVPEVRLETVVPKTLLSPVLSALFAAHPYEEVAYDLITLENPWPDAALGRLGRLDAPTTAGAFLSFVRETLPAPRAVLLGDPAQPVDTIALCTGAGGEFLDYATRAGANLYLTAELKHHQAIIAGRSAPAVIDAGHFPTEYPVSALLADYLSAQFPTLIVTRAVETDPYSNEPTRW